MEEGPTQMLLLAYDEHPEAGLHDVSWRHTTGNDIYFRVIMEGADFRTALEDAVQFLEFKLKKERELCLEICFRKDFLGVLPTVYGKSLASSKSFIPVLV